MSNRTPAIVASVVTVILLVIVALLISFTQLIALNGFSERAGTIALATSLGCQGIGGIIAVTAAARMTNRFIIKNNWNSIPAVLVAVLAGAVLGTAIAVVSLFGSIFLAQAL